LFFQVLQHRVFIIPEISFLQQENYVHNPE